MTAPNRRLRPFELSDVRIEGGFWGGRVRTNRQATIPHVHKMCKATGRIDAFGLTWRAGEPNPPHIFWDSDVAKWIEAASYALATHPDRRLAGKLDDVVKLVAGAQREDGYLNPHFTLVEPEKRWTNLRDCHELYCAGHLIEAAVAHHQATGRRTLLDAACRYADHIGSVFAPGRRAGYPGHEEVELALVKLYRATSRRRYLALSKHFIDERGRRPHFFDAEAVARGEDPAARTRARGLGHEVCQAHLPVRRQREAVGHAVRAMYLYSGMADVAAETRDAGLLAACRRLWDSATTRRMYLTGGIGSTRHGERLTSDYDLPNESAYAETCAAIGLVLFAWRMLQIDPDARYADVMERALCNGLLSGVSLDGRKFFYVNPLASAGGHHRQRWFGCACCPPNVARLLASLGLYVYSAAQGGVYVHLYAAGQGTAEVAGRRVTIAQQTDYPWDGKVTITLGLDRPGRLALMLRIPGWCRKWKVKVNGRAVAATAAKGYARLSRFWRDGDVVELSLAMPVRRTVAHPAVVEDAGKVALQRGPIVYCLEQCDHSADVRCIRLPDRAALAAHFDENLLGGAVVISGRGLAPARTGWKGRLYRPARAESSRPVNIKAVPYCLWDNRAPGAMTVWLPRA